MVINNFANPDCVFNIIFIATIQTLQLIGHYDDLVLVLFAVVTLVLSLVYCIQQLEGC